MHPGVVPMAKLILFLLFVVSFAANSVADPVEVEVIDGELHAEISLNQLYQIDLTIAFEDVIGLTTESLVINATQINPLDIALLSRIGPSNLFNIPAGLPVLINITPSPTSALSFTGPYEIELSTSNLVFDPKLRIFTSPNGGNFEDITTFSGIGSYRVRGTSGDFSDFLIITDLRTPTVATNDKYSRLQNSLNNHASRITPEMLANLQQKLDASKASFLAGNKNEAAQHLEDFITLIQTDNGQSMPNTYRANDENAINVAGELRRKAATLIFSLRL
jgi:hypothetical protein